MEHWHYSRPSEKAVKHSHTGGDKIHIHSNKGWLGYGRTKESLMQGAKKL